MDGLWGLGMKILDPVQVPSAVSHSAGVWRLPQVEQLLEIPVVLTC